MPIHQDHLHDAPLRLTCLGSGSSGNATVAHAPDGLVLVDAGFSARETLRRVEAAGLDASLIRAIVVTHGHGDHVRGVRVLASRLSVPVWATAGTLQETGLDESCADPRIIKRSDSVRIAGATLTTFPTSHDTADPIGIRLEFDEACIAIVTDTGEITPSIQEALEDCDEIALECNHDVDMLTNGPYPWFLKQRILSTRGHLSNDDASATLEAICSDRLHTVHALHLSETNNTRRLARRALTRVLERISHPGRVITVGPNGPDEEA